MTDSELNEAIFREVETDDVRTTDYCNDPVWCVQMMEKHKVNLNWSKCYRMDEWKWFAEHGEPGTESYIEVSDPILTRAVALAVLQLTREGK